MAPPQLTTDAPILDVLQPVQVNLAPALGVKLDEPITHDRFRLLDARVTQPPLPREPRLDRRAGTLGVADIVRVRLIGDERPTFLQDFRRLLAPGKTIHARQLRAGEFVEHAIS